MKPEELTYLPARVWCELYECACTQGHAGCSCEPTHCLFWHLSSDSEYCYCQAENCQKPAPSQIVDAEVVGVLIVTRGLPSSGKTTAALQQVAEHRAQGVIAARVGADDIRDMLGITWRDGSDMVWSVARGMILAMFGAGVTVVVWDATGAHQSAGEIQSLADDVGAGTEVEIIDLTGVPVGVCVARDAARPLGVRVGADVIRAMAHEQGWESTRGDDVGDGRRTMRVDFDGARLVTSSG
jgi:predicted kinase